MNRDTIDTERQRMLADYYRAKAALEANSVRATDVEFARLLSALLEARQRMRELES